MFIAINSNGQNIYTALHLNEQREYKATKPKKIIETNTFYNTSGKQVDKNIKTFDAAGMLQTEERFEEDGNLTARLTYIADTLHKIFLSRTMERWGRGGYTKETAVYSYDSNYFLIRTADKDANGNITMNSYHVNDAQGHPVELTVFDGNGHPYGKETATYFYERNMAIVSVFSNAGNKLSTDSGEISFLNAALFPGGGSMYNTHADATNWVSKNLRGEETFFESEYVYDKFGNCTKNKIYKVIVKPNGKRKKDIDRIFEKEYFY